MKKIFEIILIAFISASCKMITSDVNQKIIYIDPGHGGIDGGCIGADGTNEKDINLAIAFELRDILINLGYVVEMTRVGDYDLASKNAKNRKYEDMRKRCEEINKGDLFVSIHVNSFPSSNCNGAQTFYNTSTGKILATTIQDKFTKVLKNTTRTTSKINEKFILDNTSVTGCICEVGFISNKEELSLLKNKEYQRKVAYAIAFGIDEYIATVNGKT